MKTILFSFLFLAISTNAFAGWGSTGGGSGVACFATAVDAKEAAATIEAKHSLSAKLNKSMKSLVTLDYYEWQSIAKWELITFKSNDYKAMVEETEYTLMNLSPLFVYRMKQAGEVIDTSKWQADRNLSRVFDTQLRSPLLENCLQVQLVERLSNNNNKLGAGPVKKAPEVLLKYNPDFFAKLDPLNKAILVIHEKLYLMAQSLGVDTSDRVRAMVMLIFSQQIRKPKPEFGDQGPAKYDIRTYLFDLFGGYVTYFGDEKKALGSYGTQESRFTAFYTIQQKMSAAIGLCIDASTDVKVCKDKIFKGTFQDPALDNETAFLLGASYIYDQSLRQLNAEFILTPLKDPAYLRRADRTLTNLCLAFASGDPTPFAENVYKKANAYCKELKR